QSDGQTEIVNRLLQQYLRCYVHEKPKQWGKFLPWAEWHYNTSIHTSTGFSPFQVVYGRPPPSLVTYLPGSSAIQAVEEELLTRENMLELLKRKLVKAQQNMQKYANTRRRPHPFKVGDFVFVKLRPYRQTSVAGNRVHKLSKRFYGPFKLLEQIGQVAFKVELPNGSKIHPVFHVSKLKLCHGNTTPSLALPPHSIENQPVIQPLTILNWKTNADGTTSVLVQWEGLFPEDATWESLTELKALYPQLHLEDKVFLEAAG
ncbi:Ty3/gypsy retrotransposon protein, partial [Trifolium medium]|nr:Ty3/gypsy retrotransposon protein [Trifolium medium]